MNHNLFTVQFKKRQFLLQTTLVGFTNNLSIVAEIFSVSFIFNLDVSSWEIIVPVILYFHTY